VGSGFDGEKLSPVIPGRFALFRQLSSQKNFYPTYPRVTSMFPLSYPRKPANSKAGVENSVENAGKPAKNPPQ